MRQLLKQYFWLSSIICLLSSSCAISKYKHINSSNQVVISEREITPVFSKAKASKYKGTIDVLKNHLSGIVIIKQTDSITTHIIFVTEIGMKMFDFEWKNNVMKTVYVFEPINKEPLVSALSENFKQMFLLDVFDKQADLLSNQKVKSFYSLKEAKHRFLTTDSTNTLISQNVFHKNKKDRFINYIFDTQTKTYTQIKSTQFGLVKIKTELNIINE